MLPGCHNELKQICDYIAGAAVTDTGDVAEQIGWFMPVRADRDETEVFAFCHVVQSGGGTGLFTDEAGFSGAGDAGEEEEGFGKELKRYCILRIFKTLCFVNILIYCRNFAEM